MPSGVFTGTTDHTYIAVQISWRTLWQDASTNQSMLRVNLSARRTNVGYQTWGTFVGGVKIAGNTHSISKQLTLGPGSEWVNFATFDRLVNHNADGWGFAYLEMFGGIAGTGWNNSYAAGTASLGKLWALPPTVNTVTATRTSDTRATIAATFGTESPRGQVSTTRLERRLATASGQYVVLGNYKGKIGSFVDNGIIANRAYTYRVTTINPAGSRNRVSGVLFTTPAAPRNVAAVKNNDLTITVSWINNAWYTPEQFRIYDNGVLVATLAGTATSWIHTDPATDATHTYTVRAVQGALVSAASVASNTVQLLAPPAAPTNLSPDSDELIPDSSSTMLFMWRHNPVDTTAQQAYNLRYRLVGSATWTTVSGTTAQSRSAPMPTVKGQYEWQVQTRGMAAAFGPWSAVATFRAVNQPGVTITSPANGSTVGMSTLTVNWDWVQLQGIPAENWRATLSYNAGGRPGETIETKAGVGSGGTVTFNARLKDAASYAVTVQAELGGRAHGATSYFTTSFPVPAPPKVTASWDETEGVAQITVGVGGGGAAATERIDLYRSVDGGDMWEAVTGGSIFAPLSIGFAMSDSEALSNGTTLYRAVAWTNLPSSTEGPVVELVTDSDAVWLGGGWSFDRLVRLPYDPEPVAVAGRERAAVQYEGRRLPVAYSGEHTNLVWTWAGTFLEPGMVPDDPGMTVKQLIAVAQDEHSVHCLRDPDGHRVYGVLADVQVTRPYPGARGYRLQLTEAERGR